MIQVIVIYYTINGDCDRVFKAKRSEVENGLEMSCSPHIHGLSNEAEVIATIIPHYIDRTTVYIEEEEVTL